MICQTCGLDKNTAENVSFSAVFFGGGEPRSKMVDNYAELDENAQSICDDPWSDLPCTEVFVPNPTFRISVIGRRILNYCGAFGAEK